MNLLLKFICVTILSAYCSSYAVKIKKSQFNMSFIKNHDKEYEIMDDSTGNLIEVFRNGKLQSRNEYNKEKALKVTNRVLSQNLIKKISKEKKGEFRVRISLKKNDIIILNKLNHPIQELKDAAFHNINAKPLCDVNTFINREGINNIIEKQEDYVIANINKEQLLRLEKSQDVTNIEEYQNYNRQGLQPSTFLSEYAFNVPQGSTWPLQCTGNGVNCATMELSQGISPLLLNCFPYLPNTITNWVPEYYYPTPQSAAKNLDYPLGSNNGHASKCLLHLMHTAPNANFFHYTNLPPAQSWVASNNIQIVSCSNYMVGQPSDPNDYSNVSIDYAAANYPFPLFVLLAGNNGVDYECDWGAYNSLSVGNAEYFVSGNYYQITNCTQTKNRQGTDRELPHVVADGFTQDLNNPDGQIEYPCLGTFSSACGTSISTPIVAGIAANVLSARPSVFQSWPEAIRAAVMLHARDIDGDYWESSVDGEDGNGIVSGYDAVNFALNVSDVIAPNNTNYAYKRGIFKGSIQHTDYSQKIFYIQVPSAQEIQQFTSEGRHLRILLTWDSSPTTPAISGSVNYLSDLDLEINVPNTGGFGSYSSNDNVEIIDIPSQFNNNLLSAGNKIGFSVDVFNHYYQSGSPSFFYYVVAWDWVK